MRSAVPPTELDTFESVFARDYAAVARMAYLLLGATGEAEEVAQEAFATLLQRWDTVDNPSGFVRTAVLNRCRDLGRRRAVRRRALDRLRPIEQTSGPESGDHLALVHALAELELPQREVVVLRYYLDHTVPEIASLTGTPAGTVKSRLHRGLARLADSLGEH
jgi:RNA polymerase sigma-70 factor, ECF subfamily